MPNKSYGRMSRINEEIRRELSEILRENVKDPRLSGSLLSVLHAETTNDLKYCKVSISVLGSKEAREAAGSVLKSAAGFIRRELAATVNLRNTPELKFVLDKGIEQGIYMSHLIDEVAEKDRLARLARGEEETDGEDDEEDL